MKVCCVKKEVIDVSFITYCNFSFAVIDRLVALIKTSAILF